MVIQMCKKIKTNEDRMIRIQHIAQEAIGSVRSVSLKLKGNSWRCVLKMQDGSHFDCIAVTDDSAIEACRGVKTRLKKIIKRYEFV